MYLGVDVNDVTGTASEAGGGFGVIMAGCWCLKVQNEN